jgi:nitroreductase
MKIDFKAEEAVRKRYSVRNYTGENIEEEKKKAIAEFVDSLDNPFGKQVRFHNFDMEDSGEKQKLGTYGVIKGAKHFIGATIKQEPMALEALGYEVEALILYLTHLGLGTCWLGGTFDRKKSAEAMKIEEGALFPIILPYGYAAEKKHFKEIAMRTIAKADQRKSWNQLFFQKDFVTPLSKEEASEFAFPLEMVRLGPSASNKQPWRLVAEGGAWHFYEQSAPMYSRAFSYDIQKIDMGIAAAHFDFAVSEKGIKGHFETGLHPKIKAPNNVVYAFSWIRE